MDINKRERSANFSLHETDILVSLVKKYQTVLENKQSDASTWKMKEAAWESIKNEFNARSRSIIRSTKTLKIKYEGLKCSVRKKSAAIRLELYRTGGGKNRAPPLDKGEEQIRDIMKLSNDGNKSILNFDVLLQAKENKGNINVPNMEECARISPLNEDMTEDVKNESSQNTSGPKKSLLEDLTEAKLELIQLQKKLLVEEIVEKRKVWQFEENERRKEAEFKEKERIWKEEQYKLKLLNDIN